MKIIDRPFSAWSGSVQMRLIRATFVDGSMRYCVRQRPSTQTVVAFSERGQIMGWLVIWPTPTDTFATVFVNKRYRGHGVAEALFERALDIRSPLAVLGWDPHSLRRFRQLRRRHPGKIIIRDWKTFRERYGTLQEHGKGLSA